MIHRKSIINLQSVSEKYLTVLYFFHSYVCKSVCSQPAEYLFAIMNLKHWQMGFTAMFCTSGNPLICLQEPLSRFPCIVAFHWLCISCPCPWMPCSSVVHSIRLPWFPRKWGKHCWPRRCPRCCDSICSYYACTRWMGIQC